LKIAVAGQIAEGRGWLALRALRAPQWVHFVVLPAATARTLSDLAGAAHGMAVAVLALGYAYGLNALADRPTDLDRRKSPLCGVDAPSSLVKILAAMVLLALGLGWLAGPLSLAATLASLAASTLYSVGPRLKDLPILGTLLNAVIFAPLLVVSPTGITPELAVVAIVFVALVLQNQLLHERADHDEDARAGTLTTARMLGARATHVGVAALGLVGAATAAWLSRSRLEALVAVLALAVVSVVVLVGQHSAAARRVSHRRWAVLAGAMIFVVTR